jgi:hypothetical protein
MAGILISYRRADTDHWAKRLARYLEQEFGGLNVFLDVASISPGKDFRKEIEQYIQRSEVVLVLIGQEFFSIKDESGKLRLNASDDYVRTEIHTALKNNKTIFPVCTDQASWPEPEIFPEDIRNFAFLNYLEINKEKDFEKIVELVAPHIRGATSSFFNKNLLHKNLDSGLANAFVKTTITVQLIEKGWLLDDRCGLGTLSHPDFRKFRFLFNQEKSLLDLEFLNDGILGKKKWKKLYRFQISNYLSSIEKEPLGLSKELNQAAINPKKFLEKKDLRKALKSSDTDFDGIYERLNHHSWENSSSIEERRLDAKKNRNKNLPFRLEETGRLYGGRRGIIGLSSDPGGHYIACGTYSRGIIVWDFFNEGAMFSLQGHKGMVSSLSFGPEGQLASGGEDGTIRIWNLKERREMMVLKRAGLARRMFKKGEDEVGHVLWSPNGSQIVSTSREHAIWLWDAITGEPQLSIAIETDITGYLFPVKAAFSPGGNELLTTGFCDCLAVFNPMNGSCLNKFPIARKIHDISYSPDGLQLAAGADRGSVFIYNAKKGTIVTELSGHDPTGSLMETLVTWVSFSPNSRWLASIANDRRLIIWDVASKQMVCCLEFDKDEHHLFRERSGATWLMDSRSLALPDDEGNISILFLKERKELD